MQKLERLTIHHPIIFGFVLIVGNALLRKVAIHHADLEEHYEK